ncbi:hypothetical protein JDV02_000372 [Purpureocillium takamizusanense]|uniref:Alpha/beta hydrolase fold-3 domain-containing protein n=1 Tax=Purpureocillium takamizusanense TaxID=2060973 RepID=A0A9Q8Q6X2_9HYPO|nr:uncharacterized protein JDV02_000372 [Purpureocillium takamizusanense]UNI13649.1 hypothetical protein JDV02_000372 [Purpureocillium takamizusanense]
MSWTSLPGSMTLLDKLSLSWLVPLFVCHWLINFITRCMPGASPLHWRQKLAISHIQSLRRSLNPRQLFALSRARLTGEAIRAYCHARGLPYAAVAVTLQPEEATAAASPHNGGGSATVAVPPPVLHVVTLASAAPTRGPTLLYAHGGGYLNPIQARGHVPLALRCAAACGAGRVVFIEYALSSEHGYPAQLVQMVAAVKYLLRSRGAAGADDDDGGGADMVDGGGIEPGELVLAGDSAGGHLIVSLLAHAVRPSPYAPPLTELGGDGGNGRKQLRAVVLLSPWVTMQTSDASFAANGGYDYLTAQQADTFIRLFRPAAGELWACPDGEGAAELWRAAFPRPSSSSSLSSSASVEVAVAKKILVTVGTGETLLDSCVKFGRDMLGAETVVLDDVMEKDGRVAAADGLESEVVLTVARGEAHVQPALDCAVGYEHGATMRAITTFLKST